MSDKHGNYRLPRSSILANETETYELLIYEHHYSNSCLVDTCQMRVITTCSGFKQTAYSAKEDIYTCGTSVGNTEREKKTNPSIQYIMIYVT